MSIMCKNNNQISKLKDIYDMTEYIAERCYCPGEIYDVSGFFYQVFSPDDECTLLCEGKHKDCDVVAVICKDQILAFWLENKKIISAERYDATENNASEITSLLTGKKSKITIDEFEKGKMQKSVSELLQLADAVLVD